MRRNPVVRQDHELARAIARAGKTPADQAAAGLGVASAVPVGGNLYGTNATGGQAGKWAPYGLVGFTPLGMPFRCRAGSKDGT